MNQEVGGQWDATVAGDAPTTPNNGCISTQTRSEVMASVEEIFLSSFYPPSR
ncbi:hypothetical protein PL9214520206 [Planktothrix tepida PCC 9214]|uniref:Uncharacterized protein n=1 Tax=Planktothrix tepida PCC 9214 TaxID=671072 RepID=A0A1J1LMF4_9CYAN|nr:hypothetical protein PL9214520206 [Planktothrix tepida PCC 9214]